MWLWVAIRFIWTTITMNSGSSMMPQMLKVIMVNRTIRRVLGVERRDLVGGHVRRHRREEARKRQKRDKEHGAEDRHGPQADQLRLDVRRLRQVFGFGKNLHRPSFELTSRSAILTDTSRQANADQRPPGTDQNARIEVIRASSSNVMTSIPSIRVVAVAGHDGQPRQKRRLVTVDV